MRLIGFFLKSKLPFILLVFSICSGVIALKLMVREEEPQIVVPIIDVIVTAQGTSTKEIERLITTPLEKLLAQIPGVEHVYSMTSNGQVVATLSFFVGENREQAILNTYNKLYANIEKLPNIVDRWLVKPIEIDDVPILVFALWSDSPALTDDYGLRRLAQEVTTILQRIDDTSEVNIVGGRSRVIQVNLNAEQLAARKTSIDEVFRAIKAANLLADHSSLILDKQSILFESGDVFRSIDDLEQTPITVIDNAVVLLKDVATIIDGPDAPKSYTWLDFAQGHVGYQQFSDDNAAVTISVAKKRGSNAVDVSSKIHEKLTELQQGFFPDHIHLELLRDYGETANEKVSTLVSSLVFAIFTVVIFVGIFLGWRAALVVGCAVPVCYGITLSLGFAFGYSINRVTLFALILSLGLLVDDPITGVDNIERYLKGKYQDLTSSIVAAINEIRVPLLLSTLTIVLAFIPLAFITGMMGPYMAPMAFNVPISIITSTVIAFLLTPWLSAKLLNIARKNNTIRVSRYDKQKSLLISVYHRLLTPLLTSRKKAKVMLAFVAVLFLIAILLPVLRCVPLKLLPFDNKNEVQVIVDMPEYATLEQTAALTKSISKQIQRITEVKTIAAYVGIASPMDFNGLIRHYYQRNKAYNADLRITLLDKNVREHQSHGIVLRLRQLLAAFNRDGVHIQVVEVPPGPPVMSTLVAELYGDEFTSYEDIQHAAIKVEQRLMREALVVEVDRKVADEQRRLRFVTDKSKAALSGITTADINQLLTVANRGSIVGYMHEENEAAPLAIKLQLPLAQRESIADFSRLTIKGHIDKVQSIDEYGLNISPQSLVALGELGQFVEHVSEKAIYHKDLKPVVYVMAEISGRTPAEVIADVSADLRIVPADSDLISAAVPAAVSSTQMTDDQHWQSRSFLNSGANDIWFLPENISLLWSGEGEWRITLRVFRDMGAAFIFALIAIYIVLRIQTHSMALSLIIMSAIPLSVIGIMPGFFLLNQFGERTIAQDPDPVLFTATAMIGMIALAGIVVRSSLILVEFISQARAKGMDIQSALLQAGSARMRPILLTAGTTLLGNLIIMLDPVFNGLAIAIIFGIISSTLFTLFVVPIVYLLVFGSQEKL